MYEEILTAEEQRPVVAEPPVKSWKGYQKFAFRATALYVLLLCIPFNERFYTRLFNLSWKELDWQQLGGIASGVGSPRFVDLAFADIWGTYSYINMLIALAIALAGAVIWTLFDRKTQAYDKLWYWVLVVARYRAAFGIIAWGYKKLIPIQMEWPSRSFMETPFADFSDQKIYWQSVGIVPHYEIFLGGAEVLAGVLLLFRRTTALGAALLAVLLFNIQLANHAYDGMVHVGSFTYAVLGVIILWPYLGNIVDLIVKEKNVLPVKWRPKFGIPWQQYTRIGLKVASIAVFVFFQFYLEYRDRNIGYRFPHNYPGLSNAGGVYDVTEFRKNNQLIAYSPVDTLRWQDAIFEDWSTFTFRLNKTQEMDLDNTGNEGKNSLNKRYEFRGVGGGRFYYNYTVDTVKQVLHLQNKFTGYHDQRQELHYTRPSDTRIILEGTNEYNDSIYVVLDKRKDLYPLDEQSKR